MRLLLDTHVWIWMLMAPERLGDARSVVEDPATRVLLSSVSTWEISIKVSAGRLTLPGQIDRYLPRQMDEKMVDRLAVDHRHALHLASLPPHHRDPFDRMLIAQAQVEKLPIMTSDRAFDAYDCEVMRVG